jgi:hypothetical protein
VLVGEVWLRADGAGRSGFAECSGMAKALASTALCRVAERDVLANFALAVEQQYLGVPQLVGADQGWRNRVATEVLLKNEQITSSLLIKAVPMRTTCRTHPVSPVEVGEMDRRCFEKALQFPSWL